MNGEICDIGPMKPTRVLIISAVLLWGSVSLISSSNAASAPDIPDSFRMLQDILTLSNPEFAGRQTGTTDDQASAKFVADRFQQLGLKPAGAGQQSWEQTSPVTANHILAPTSLEFSLATTPGTPLTFVPQLGPQYLPVLDSPSINVLAPITFVGYGISDPARGWDEYEHLDVHNRIVMFLRGKPPHYPLHIQHTEKEHLAREKGAIGFITLTGPVLSRYAMRRGMGHQPLAFYTNALEERPLPGGWVDTKVGENLFTAEGLSLPQIQETLNTEQIIQSKTLNTLVHLKWESVQHAGSLVNVLGMIPGTDPVFAHETIILGAHRDHFGKQAGLLFPGADDNASGTALMMEIARVLMKGQPLKRTILFASFSGEEQNLLGSTWYVEHPTLAPENVIAMINVDHVGTGNGKLTVGVSKIPKNVATLAAETASLSDKLNLYGYFPGGDHVPFAKAGIPTIAISSAGKHPHFHQPSDTADTINPEIMETAARFVLALTKQLANSE